MLSFTVIWRKRLYGLRLAPRCWSEKLAMALRTFEFKQSYPDNSLFFFVKNGIILHVIVYVNDFIVADLAKLKYFFGIEVSLGPDGIFLSQRKYSQDIITEAGLRGAKKFATPVKPNHNLTFAKGLFMQTPLLPHWEAAIRVVQYLKGCPVQGILLRSDSAVSLIAYCDSDGMLVSLLDGLLAPSWTF
ncbi:PREDICTED: uncharacterized protein LOC109126586 [Camelina sativa]|uniref:Uncharacterized protein LOC109126586 n=1 Tax=Camelina sativa TaxID=90675 RepID=A0ABM1QGC9_CAMSA|nr:PREDICTED: uncharacterized protein LOC109126586 [Camelina sativa]